MKRALIIGVSGQDGAYLSQLLLSKGYQVYGTSRDVSNNKFKNFKILNLFEKIKLLSVDTKSEESIRKAIEITWPDEIYNLSGQSSVGLSFEFPQETSDSIVDATRNILNAIKTTSAANNANKLIRENKGNKEIRFFSAGSGECFGDTTLSGPANETTPFNPQSPYAEAKAKAYELVKEYREQGNLFACTGILFNHESPLRPSHFVTQKIIQGASEIAQNLKAGFPIQRLYLGNLAIRRDWGWAPEYVEAMWLMLQYQKPEDFVIATGKTHSLEQLTDAAFAQFDLIWRDYVEIDQLLFRPGEPLEIAGNPNKIKGLLHWSAKSPFAHCIKGMHSSKGF